MFKRRGHLFKVWLYTLRFYLQISCIKAFHYLQDRLQVLVHHCRKSVCIQSFSGPYFPAFRVKTEFSVYHHRKIFIDQLSKLNPFLANFLVSYPLKTIEKFWFSGVFRRYKMGTLARNRLILVYTLGKKLSFLLRISLANVTKSAVSCGFNHIYWIHS